MGRRDDGKRYPDRHMPIVYILVKSYSEKQMFATPSGCQSQASDGRAEHKPPLFSATIRLSTVFQDRQ